MIKKWIMCSLIPVVSAVALGMRWWLAERLALFGNAIKDYTWFNSLYHPQMIIPGVFMQYWGFFSLILVFVAALVVAISFKYDDLFKRSMQLFGWGILLYILSAYWEHLALIWQQTWMFMFAPLVTSILFIYLMRLIAARSRVISFLLVPYIFTALYSFYYYFMIFILNFR